MVPMLALEPHCAVHLLAYSTFVILRQLALLPISTAHRLSEEIIIFVRRLLPKDRLITLYLFLLKMLKVSRWKHLDGQLLHLPSQSLHLLLNR